MRNWLFVAAVMLLEMTGLSAHARQQVAIDGQGRLHVFGLAYAGSTKVIQYAYLSGGTWNIRRLPGALKEAPVVVTNSQGTIYVVGIGTDNAIYFTRGSGDYFQAWTDLGGERGIYTAYDPESAPSIGVNRDGRVEIFVTGNNHYAYHAWETCTGCGTFAWWDLVNWSGYHLNDDPAVGRNLDGRLEIFVSPSMTSGVGVLPHSDILGHVWQDTPNGAWHPTWENWSSPAGTFYAQPVVASNQDGRLEVFIWTDDGISHRWQISPGWVWSDWATLTPPGFYGERFTVSRDLNGNLMIFAEASGICPGHTPSDPFCHSIAVRRQLAPNSDWESHWSGTYFPDGIQDSYTAIPSDAIATSDGKMHVFAYDYYALKMKHGASNPILDGSGHLVGHSWSSNSWEDVW